MLKNDIYKAYKSTVLLSPVHCPYLMNLFPVRHCTILQDHFTVDQIGA